MLCANGVGRADMVLINGRVVVRGGQLMTVDVGGELVAAHSAASARICSHYSKEAIGGGQ